MRDSSGVVVETRDGATAGLTAELRDLYAAGYAEPPYLDGPAEIAEFVAGRRRPARGPRPGRPGDGR